MSKDTLGSTDLDEEIQLLGKELLSSIGDAVPGLFDMRRWEGKALEWAMRDPQFKVDLFRFVDVLPSLKSSEEVTNHVREYLARGEGGPTGILGVATKIAATGLAPGLLSKAIEKNVMNLARRFIVGGDATEALAHLRSLHEAGFAFTVDLLGEKTLSDAEADAYASRYFDLIENLPGQVRPWPADKLIDNNHLGPLPRANVSLKISSMDPRLDCLDAEGGVSRLKSRILPLVLHARKLGVTIHLDLESWELHELTFDLFEALATHPELRDWPHLGMTLQAYLKSSAADLDRLLSIAKARRTPIGVRLAKGAYWDSEVVRSRQHGYPCPVFMNKGNTDARYEQLTVELIDNAEWFHPKFASHNLRSLVHAVVYAREKGLPLNAIEAQTLYGMAEPEREALRRLGCRVRVYSPVGDLLPGMAYLVRRLLENTSNQGFLRITHREHPDPSSLFVSPVSIEELEPVESMVRGDVTTPFANCPLTDWTDEVGRKRMSEAIDERYRTLPVRVPVVIDGKECFQDRTMNHPCPSDIAKTATELSLASPKNTDAAVAVAASSWPSWRDRPLKERAGYLEKLADLLEEDRYRLAAHQVWEVGKPWREADADVAEAIDFCRYYARMALLELGTNRFDVVPGERNLVWYEGRGPTVVIAPWNFPLAILTGMACAALVAGNTVVLKPAEQSSGVAYGLFEKMMEAGLPTGAVQFLPGLGEEVGAQVARHPGTANIVFTGSRAVGLSLAQTAGRVAEGQDQLKRLVCEMGGKNAIIVDEDADLDAAVSGVLVSAFGYAGQKCSACSRVITVGAIYAPFVERLVGACRSLPILPAQNPDCILGPVVDREAFERLKEVLSDPGIGATPLFVGKTVEGGNYIPPAVYEVADANHRLMQEELFGPVVAVHRAKDFKQAIEVANSTEYALTGALYSRKPSHLEMASKMFRVGNLYFNRTCTGAVVGRQPFGGFRMSGLGTKAGGPGYLYHFCNPRTVCENTVRRGFTPEVQV